MVPTISPGADVVMQPGQRDSGALGGKLYAVCPRLALFLGAHFAMDTDCDDEDQHESQKHGAVLRTSWVISKQNGAEPPLTARPCCRRPRFTLPLGPAHGPTNGPSGPYARGSRVA